MQRIAEFNRRTLDALAARVYFYWAWTTERTGELSDIRGRLLALHRTAVLRHDEYGQETVLNLLLRNYLHYNQYEQVGAGWVSNMGFCGPEVASPVAPFDCCSCDRGALLLGCCVTVTEG